MRYLFLLIFSICQVQGWSTGTDTVGVRTDGLSTYFIPGVTGIVYSGSSQNDIAGEGAQYTGANEPLEWNSLFRVDLQNVWSFDISNHPYLETVLENKSGNVVEIVFDLITEESGFEAKGDYYPEYVGDDFDEREFYRTRIILQPYEKDTFIVDYTGASTISFMDESVKPTDLQHVRAIAAAALPGGYPQSWLNETLEASVIEVSYLKMGSYVDYNPQHDFRPYGRDIVTACDSYTWINSQVYTADNNTDRVIINSTSGGDSLVILNLNMNYSNTGTDIITACDSYTWIDGIEYAASNNTATYTLTNAAGCDSVVTLDLTVKHSSYKTDNQIACESYTWIDGLTYTASNNTATYVLTNSVGCDSVITLNLRIGNPTTGIATITSCDEYTWIDGITYTADNNTAQYTLMSFAGCDSVVTLNLNIEQSSQGTDDISACDSHTWINGQEYLTSNTEAVHVLNNSVGCDSVVTLDLTVAYSSTSIDEIISCDAITWLDGLEYTSSNNLATYTVTNAAGCDSIITLDFKRNANSGTDIIGSCDPIIWIDGVEYTESNNSATFVLTNSLGCDSLVSLNLTISQLEGDLNCNGVLDTDEITGLSDFENDGVLIYPNPVSNEVIVHLERATETSVQLFNSQGQLLLVNSLIGNKYKIDLQDIESGIYYLQLNQNGVVSTHKILKQ